MARAGMYGSEAGLVRIEKAILTTSAASANSGPTCLEAKNWRNWTFTVEGSVPNGCTITWYFTNDPNTAGSIPGCPPQIAVAITAANWYAIPAEAIQSGTGIEANPMVGNGGVMVATLSYDRPALAIRAVIAGNTPGNVITCKVAATP